MIKEGVIIASLITIICVQHTVSPFKCGVVQNRVNELIVHGFETVPGEWPWHAAIYHGNETINSYACGGTLIRETFIITAAHCVRDKSKVQLPTSFMFVRLGVHNLSAPSIHMFQQIAVEKIHQPSKYMSETFRNDIALLELVSAVQFNDYVQPACISSERDVAGEFGTVVGWGLTENDQVSDTLKSVRMPVIDSVECLASNRPMFGRTLDSRIFCAGYTNGTSVCNGDSGGGMFFYKNNVWFLKGIVSFSAFRSAMDKNCDKKGYAAFTRVYTYLPWISSITKQQVLFDETNPGYCKPKDAKTNGNYTNLLPRTCGVYSTNHSANEQNSKLFEFPWMAIIQHTFHNGDKHILTVGTVINKRYVLTTYIDRLPKGAKVILGEHNIGQDIDCDEIDGETECAPPVREYGIECFTEYQNYIDLIRLDRDVVFEDHIQPVCLPVTPALRKFNPPQYIKLGWGKGILQKITVRRSGLDYIFSMPRYGYICRGERKRVSLRGYMGAPLGYVINYKGMMRYVQFGIFNLKPCDRGAQRILRNKPPYTNVSFFMDWIIANMEP